MKIFIIYIALFFLNIIVYGQNDGIIINGNAKIFYRTYGKGTPILIINGGPGMNSDGFVNLAVMLSKNNKTIIYDQRGTGRSTVENPDSLNITMKLMVSDIECLRKNLKIDQWIILGHSFGGMLASYYATFYPEHILGMILSSSGGIDLSLLDNVRNSIDSKLTQRELDEIKYWGEKIENGDTSHYAKLQRGKALAAAYVYNKKNIPIIAERLTQGYPLITNLVWQDLQRIKFDCSKKLSTFNKPVLIIQGKQDIVGKDLAEKAHKVLRNSKLVFLNKCVHYGWLDRPDEYFKEINKFIFN
jgi:proline iminopeptidase